MLVLIFLRVGEQVGLVMDSVSVHLVRSIKRHPVVLRLLMHDIYHIIVLIEAIHNGTLQRHLVVIVFIGLLVYTITEVVVPCLELVLRQHYFDTQLAFLIFISLRILILLMRV